MLLWLCGCNGQQSGHMDVWVNIHATLALELIISLLTFSTISPLFPQFQLIRVSSAHRKLISPQGPFLCQHMPLSEVSCGFSYLTFNETCTECFATRTRAFLDNDCPIPLILCVCSRSLSNPSQSVAPPGQFFLLCLRSRPS